MRRKCEEIYGSDVRDYQQEEAKATSDLETYFFASSDRFYLRVLWEQDGITQRDLSVRLGLMEPTVHTALTKMLKAGLIRREHKDGNKKKNYIYLSETGRSLRAELEPLAVEVNEVASEGLPDILVDQLRSALIHMYENLSDDEANAVKQGLSMPSTRHLGESK